MSKKDDLIELSDSLCDFFSLPHGSKTTIGAVEAQLRECKGLIARIRALARVSRGGQRG
jgi:hypothetical protein